MGVYQWRDHKKRTGGKRNWYYKVKRKYAHGRLFVPTVLAETEKQVEVRKVRVRGGNTKLRVRRVIFAVVSDPDTGKSQKAKILSVIENPANREYARRNIIVKGTIIETELGKAVVTNRPGQDGVVNAVLIKEKKE